MGAPRWRQEQILDKKPVNISEQAVAALTALSLQQPADWRKGSLAAVAPASRYLKQRMNQSLLGLGVVSALMLEEVGCPEEGR